MLLQSDSWWLAIPVSLHTAALPQQTQSGQAVSPFGLVLLINVAPSCWPVVRWRGAFSVRLPSAARCTWMRLLTFIEIQTVMSQADLSVNIRHQKCFSFLLPASRFQTRAHTHLHPQVFPLSFFLLSLLFSTVWCWEFGQFHHSQERKVHKKHSITKRLKVFKY